MADENVSVEEALTRSIDNWVAQQSTMAEGYLRPKLPELVARIKQDLDAFDMQIVKKKAPVKRGE
jgi:hypothetical protein